MNQLDPSSPIVNPLALFKPEWEVTRKSVHADRFVAKYDVIFPDKIAFPPISHHMIVLQLSHGTKQLTQIGDEEYRGEFAVGEFILNPAYRSSFYAWESTDETVVFCLEPAFLSRIARETECLNPDKIELKPILCGRDPHIEYIARSFLSEMQTDGLGGRLYSETLATQLGIQLLRNYSAFPIDLKQYDSGLSLRKLQTVIDYIQANLEEKISLNTLAEITEISPYYFCRLFKKSTGITPYQYFIKCRIDRAKVLLKERKMSISDVAFEVGFSNQSHFTKHFKRLVGTTPKVYQDR